MSGVQKFMFDTQFDAPAPEPEPEIVPEILPELPPEPPPPTFSEAELEQARQIARAEGRAEGLQQGRAEALGGLEQEQVRLFEAIAHRLGALLSEQAAGYTQQREMILRIALTIARKMLPAYAERYGQGEIEALVLAMLNGLMEEPRLVVRVADNQLDAVTVRLQREVEARGFAGRIIFMGDAALGPADCLIEWADGGAGRDMQRLWGEVDRVVAQVLQSPPVMPQQAVTEPNTGTTSIES